MNKLKQWLVIETVADERTQLKELRSFHNAGLFIVVLAILDVIVRGFILDRPASHWGASLVYVIVYVFYALAKMALEGIYDTEVDDERSFKKKMKQHFWTHLTGGLFFAIVMLFLRGMPETLRDWLRVLVTFVVVIAFLQLYEWVFTKISLRRTQKELDQSDF